MSEDRPDPDQTDLPSTEAAPSSMEQQQIGPYRLLQKLGEGGMGEVWLAEQIEPVKRKVALKVIKRGMDSKQVVARFEAERQALAMTDHPAVAKVVLSRNSAEPNSGQFYRAHANADSCRSITDLATIREWQRFSNPGRSSSRPWPAGSPANKTPPSSVSGRRIAS